MTRKQGEMSVGLSSEREELVRADVFFQSLRVVDRLAGEIRVVEFLGESDTFLDVRGPGFEFEKRFELLFQPAALEEISFALSASFQQLGGTHGLLERIDFVFESRDVKDTS